MTLKLPPPVVDYFAASNADDADRLAATFAPEARVHDEKEDHVGRAAVGATNATNLQVSAQQDGGLHE